MTGSESRDGLGGSGDGLETEGGGELSGFRVGGLAVMTCLLRGSGDCLDTEGAGEEKEEDD